MKRYSLLIILLTWVSLNYAQEGTLDPTFASKGWTTFANYPKGNYVGGWISKTLVQGDKFLSIMYINGSTLVARFNQNGSLDLTFGSDGYSKPLYLEYPGGCLQSDGKIIIVGNTYNPTTEQREIGVMRLTFDGIVDNTFGSSGMASFGSGWSWDESNGDVTCQADNKIVIAANYYNSDPAAYYISVARLTADGILDTNFDSDGIFQLNNNYWCPPTGVVIQSDQKIVIGGFISLNGYRFYALRLNANGTVDTGYGTSGITYIDFGNSSLCRAIAIQPNDYVVLAGQFESEYGDPKLYDFALARLDANGALDNSFGGTGTVTTDFGNTYDYAYSVAINNSNGKIIAVGGTEQSINEVAIACYKANGTLDTGFDTDGKQMLSFSDYSWGYSVSLLDGKVFLGGESYSYESEISYMGVALLNANGTLDTGFDTDGILAYYYPSNLMNYFNSVALQSSGKTIVSASIRHPNDYDTDPLLLRYNQNGTLDETFGTSGKVLTLFDTYGWFPAMQVAGDDKIVVAGYIYSITYSDLAILKFNSNGTPDLTFGTNGQVIVDFGMDVYATGVYVSPTNQIVVAGEAYNESGDSSDVLIARFTSAGVLDNSFGVSGYTIIDFGDGQWEWGNGIAALGTGYIISAGTWSDTETDAIEKYALALIDNNGALNTGFDGDGMLVSNGPNEAINSIMTLSGDKIAIGGKSNNNFMIAMYNSNGTLNTSFGTTGIVTIDVNANEYEDAFLSIQDDSKFLLTGSSGFYPNEDITTVRIGNNGIVDASFGTGGILVTDLGSIESIRSTVWGNDRLYAVGTYDEAFERIGLVAVFNTAASFTAAPAITLNKMISSGSPYDGVGDVIHYSFRITNSGNVALAGPFTVTDDRIGEIATNSSLDIGAQVLVSGTYTITQSDLDVGAVTNVAYAATTYEGSPVMSGTDTETAMATQSPALTINKQITGGDPFIQAGDVVNYSYTITNSGNVTLAGPFTVTDDKIGTITGNGPLAPGANVVVNGSYTILSTDVTAGFVTNVAYASTLFNSGVVNSGTDTETANASTTPPVITITDVTLNEASPGAALTVSLNKTSTNAIVVNYDTQDGTATSKGRYPDYKSTRGTVTILPGSTSALVLITMKDDGRAEPDQHFYVNLSLGRKMTGLATISDGLGMVTISAHGGALIPDEEARMNASGKDDIMIDKLTAKAYPNPTTGFFTLQVQSANTAPVTVRVLDATGKLIESRTGIAANSSVQLGNNYRPGVYYAEVVQGSEKVTVKLVKQSD